MSAATLLLVSLGTVVLATVLLVVYAIRCVVRVIGLYAAVWFFQAEGTRGDVTMLAQEMTNFVFRGRRKGGGR